MKKVIAVTVLCMLLVSQLPLGAAAATDMHFLAQPQNPVYAVGAVAGYSVTVAGEDLECTWYLNFEGTDYDLSKAGNPQAPWEAYAGASYGPATEENKLSFPGNHVTFSYYFSGIGEELNGSYIYAVIDNGQYTIKSDIAWIQLMEGAKTPPSVLGPSEVETTKGQKVELICSATASFGGELTYTWYETHDGDLSNANPLAGGNVQGNKLVCDTDSYGMRYYVCGVREEGGGHAYTNVIPVMVMEGQPLGPDEPEPTTKPVTEPTQPTTEPVTEPTQPATEPVTEPTQPDTEPVTEPTQPQLSRNDTSAGEDIWIYVGIGLGVVAAGMAVTIILLLKPKKKSGK